MSQTVPNPAAHARGIPDVVRATRELYLPAARRLVSQVNQDLEHAARRLVETAPRHGIDFSLCFVTLEPAAKKQVRQACLAVPGQGRTAMLFISEPSPQFPRFESTGVEERSACVDAACRHLHDRLRDTVRLAQTLPEPEELWVIEACKLAGFVSVGTLIYMRREAGEIEGALTPRWPDGVTVDRVCDLSESAPTLDRLIMEALEASYADTLDCPELCGLRDMPDVLASHRSTGVYDPSTWWLIRRDGRPEGAMLLSQCPEQKSYELVYLGLGPGLRGQGLGRELLRLGIHRVRAVHPSWAITCAVDERNAPALALYERLGFEAYTRRVALVRPI